MFVHPNGFPFALGIAETMVPKLVARPAAAMFCRQMKKQLNARGLARHSDEVIARKGIADVNAIEAALGDKTYLSGKTPFTHRCLGLRHAAADGQMADAHASRRLYQITTSIV